MKKLGLSRNSFFWWGIFFPMPALAFGVGDYKVGFANFIFLFIVLKKLAETIRIKRILDRTYTLHFAFFISILLTMSATIITLNDDWLVKALGFESKMLFFLFCFIFFFSSKELKKNKVEFLRGLAYASVINLVWGWAQMYFGYVQGVNINKEIFGELLGIDAGINWDQSVANNVVYRISGLSWEPASFAIIEIIGFVLIKNVGLRLLIILTLFASTSKTAIILIGVVFAYWMYLKIKTIFKKNFIKLSKKTIFNLAMLSIILTGIMLYFNDFALNYFQRVFDLGMVLTEALTTNTNSSANIHKMYYEKAGYILDQSSVYNCLFGYGMFVAGFPYTQNNLGISDDVWTPETDVITLLMGNGIIGFALYYLILIKGFFQADNYIDKKFILIQIVGGITYLFCQGWMIPLFLITLSNQGYKEKYTFKELDNCKVGER